MDNYNDEVLRIIDDVMNNRPYPNRFCDQIYMYGVDMLKQAEIVGYALDNKKVLFLGDDDGMCMLFLSLYSKVYSGRQIDSVTVLDFDERILKGEEKFFTDIGSELKTKINFGLSIQISETH